MTAAGDRIPEPTRDPAPANKPPAANKPPKHADPVRRQTVTAADYHRLLQVRTGLRQFLRWSENQANQAGLTGTQHQLLLAIKGHPDQRGPTIGDIADYLLLKHHSAVGLIDRAETAGLIVRHDDPDDRRITRLALSPKAETNLATLAALHLEELTRLAPKIHTIWQDLTATGDPP